METVEIWRNASTRIALVKNLYPLNIRGDILRYSQELSDYGTCTFRVATQDPLFDQFGDILQPHTYHVRVLREGAVVWIGAIIDNPIRNRNYVEVVAAEYEFYLSKILVRRDTVAPTGFNDGTDSWKNYRTFSSGTMASAVQSIITSMTTDFGAGHVLGSLTIGTIDNPDYPSTFSQANGGALEGGWNFTDEITLRFDYHSVAYVLRSFGAYALCDYEVTKDLVFNFKEFIGNKQNPITFEYGTHGNIIDYNVPRLGRRMVNDLWGIAADEEGAILHANQRDEESVQTYGMLQDASAYSDVKTKNFLKTRMAEELQFLKTPEDAPVSIVVDEKTYPFGMYSVGDIVTVKIRDNVISFNQARRIVGMTIVVHNTGKRTATIQTNKPRDRDMGS